jgi:hypothetical protein
MRQSLKIAISLLASILLFAGFAVLSFANLFSLLQTSFFLPRIEQGYQNDLAALAQTISAFHDHNLRSFEDTSKLPFIADSFGASPIDPSLSNETLQGWADLTASNQLFGVRLIGADGKRILFSSLPKDRDESKSVGKKLVFKNYDSAENNLPVEDLLVEQGAAPKVLIDGARSLFVYALPVSGPAGSNLRGTLAFYVSSRDLLSLLIMAAGGPVASLDLVGTRGLLINGPAASVAADRAPITQAISAVWDANASRTTFVAPLSLQRQGGAAVQYRIFSLRLDAGGIASLAAPASRFEMQDVMKYLLLATFFFTVFLLIYLLLNLRTDPLEVLRQRVKRFQIQLISELVESPGGADWGRWRRELETRKEEITWQIQRGIGRVSRRQKPVLDEYMTKSWAEIIDLISRKSEAAPAVGSLDISRLESLIQAALQNARFTLPTPRGPAAGRAVSVEEISAAEVTEAPAEAASGAAPVEAEEVEELEEVSEEESAEVVEEALPAEEVEELEEAEEAESAEEVVEAEPAVEAEEVGERAAEAGPGLQVPAPAEALQPAEVAEMVEELESAEEGESVGPPPPAEITEIDAAEVDELQPVVEPEELAEDAREGGEFPEQVRAGLEQAKEAGAAAALSPVPDVRAASETEHLAAPRTHMINDFIEVRIPGAAARTSADADAVLPATDIDYSADKLEELETLQEIVPLPPEPVEEGLELLPPADEAGATRGATGGLAMTQGDDSGNRDAPYSDEESSGAPSRQEKAERSFGEQESITDLEELEAADEELAAAAVSEAALSQPDLRAELAKLLSAGAIKAWTIPELQKMVEEGKSAIVMENGVFRIKEEVYTAAEKAREPRHDPAGLREIARDLVRGDPGAAARDEENAGGEEGSVGGIGDLLGTEDSVDLAKMISSEKSPPQDELLGVESEKANPIRLTHNGLDYDNFLSSYPRSFTHTKQMKSLVEISRRVSAVSAGLSLKKVQGYVPDLTVGMSEKSITSFQFGPADPFYASLLLARKVVGVNRNPAEIRIFRTRFDAEDVRYMKRLLFIPAIFRGQEAYLFLSFSSETEISLETILSKLIVR